MKDFVNRMESVQHADRLTRLSRELRALARSGRSAQIDDLIKEIRSTASTMTGTASDVEAVACARSEIAFAVSAMQGRHVPAYRGYR